MKDATINDLMAETIRVERVVFAQRVVAPKRRGQAQSTAPIGCLESGDYELRLSPSGVFAWRKDAPENVRLYLAGVVSHVDFPVPVPEKGKDAPKR